MFTEIAANFPELTFDMFDYGDVDQDGNTVVVPLHEQVSTLNEKLDRRVGENITLLCHSQGCVVAAMSSLHNVERCIFLAPPEVMSVDRMIKTFGKREGSSVDFEGITKFARSDGSKTIVPSAYFESIKNVNPKQLFVDASKKCKIIIVKAAEDQIVGDTDFSGTDIQVLIVPGDHDFFGKDRPALLNALDSLLD